MRRRALLALVAASALVGLAGVSAFDAPRAQFARFHFPQRALSMPGFGRQEALAPSQIEDLVEYVLALSHRQAETGAVIRAIPLYERHCQACHGPTGQGDPASGVPDLSDEVWRWGGAREDIREQIWRGDDGRGPPRQAAHRRGWGV